MYETTLSILIKNGSVVFYIFSKNKKRTKIFSSFEMIVNINYKKWSGKRGSNSRHSAWKADALPTELFPQQNNFIKSFIFCQYIFLKLNKLIDFQ